MFVAQGGRSTLSRFWKASAAVALVLVLVGGVPARAAGAEAEDPEALIRQGMELRRQGQDARALPYFEKAYQRSRNPRTAAQLGLVKMALGYWIEAERYLSEGLATPDHPWISKNRSTLESARTNVRGMIGELTVVGEPAGAEVLVNGQPAGKLPLASPIRLGKGAVEVELRAPGYASTSRSLTIAGGGSESVSIALARVEEQRQAAGAGAGTDTNPMRGPDGGAPGGGGDGRGDSGTARPDEPPSAPRSGSPGAMRTVAWTLGGLGAASLVFGVVETFVAVSRKNAFNNHTAPSPTPENPYRRVPDCTTAALSDECRSLAAAYDSAKTLAVVGYVVGAALATTSVVLLVMSAPGRQGDKAAGTGAASSPSTNSPAAALACAPSLATPGFLCSLRF
jgi:hypothetical protein